MQELDFLSIILGTIAGLVLFLYGVEQLATVFQDIAGERARSLISQFTSNRFTGVLTGTVATTILDSSSVTIIMVIAMVHSGLLTFVQSLGVVMGANIGTTVGSQIIAFEIHQYAPIAMAIGAVLRFGGKTERHKNTGMVFFGAGLLFFGLDYLGDAMSPLKEHQPFIDWMATLGEHPLMGVLAGAAFTLVIQSSSATVGTAIIMAMEGLLPLSSGIAIMLGAEIGTVSTTIIATIGRSRGAVRTALFHLFFNISTVILGLVAIEQITQFAQWITPGGTVARHIANAHVFFNVFGVALFIGPLPWLAKLLYLIIPEKTYASLSEPG